MTQPSDVYSPDGTTDTNVPQAAWQLVKAAAAAADRASLAGRRSRFALGANGELRPTDDHDHAAPLAWEPDRGWTALPAVDDDIRPFIDLYLPVCSATAARPMTLGHLGESLDGFIATHTGDSRWVTGRENVVHMHRLRALCDAVVVGAGTVAADDPWLTTRLVAGTNPLRVVLDPGRRLAEGHRVFRDDSSPTLYVCDRELVADGERSFGTAEVCPVAGGADSLDLGELMQVLRGRGCTRIFVEGGGVTISAFLQAGLLDRLHLAIAPLLIGDGRAAIRLPAPAALGDCHRPDYRVFRMGGDILFDCDLRTRFDDSAVETSANVITRVV